MGYTAASANVLVNPKVGLLFIDFEHPQRLRINGEATLYDSDPLLAEFEGAQLIVRVRATCIFPNCPRYIHEMRLIKHSVYPEPEDVCTDAGATKWSVPFLTSDPQTSADADITKVRGNPRKRRCVAITPLDKLPAPIITPSTARLRALKVDKE